MSGWTRWRKIADRDQWFDDALNWEGPACYELAIAGPRGGDLTIVYVGETANERKRMSEYASHGSHLSDTIESHLKRGRHLYYRAQGKKSKQEAVAMQNRLLDGFDYDWNIQRNGKKYAGRA